MSQIDKKIKRIIYECDDGSEFIDEHPNPLESPKNPYTAYICRICKIDTQKCSHYCCMRDDCPSRVKC